MPVTAANHVPELKITDTKLYVPLITLSSQDNATLLKQVESGFKRTIISIKYQSKKTNQVPNKYLHFLIDPNFQGLYRLFVLSIKHDDGWENYKQHYLPTVEMKYHNVMSDRTNFFG